MNIRTNLVASLLTVLTVSTGLLLSGCASAPTATPTASTASSPRAKFNQATSGKVLAAKVAARAKSAGVTVTGVECKNFLNVKVGTHTDCQMRVNGVKQGIRATFAQRDGHFELKTQKLTW